MENFEKKKRGEKPREKRIGTKSTELKWRTAINSLQDAVSLMDSSNIIIDCNSSMGKFCGLALEDIIGRHCWEIVHGTDAPIPECPAILMQKTRRRESLEISHQERWYRVTADPLLENGGRITGVVHILTDITSAREDREKIRLSLREKEVLMREIHHRVKNSLQTVESLLFLEFARKKSEGAQNLYLDLCNRIHAMALIHQHLYRSPNLVSINFRTYLMQLMNDLLDSFGLHSEEIQLRMKIADIPLSIDIINPLGLILNELVSNAIKHAFPAEAVSKKIKISLKRGPDNRLELSVSDNGRGLPSGIAVETTDTLGLQLVKSLVGQIHGNLGIESNGGTRFVIRFIEIEP